MVMKMPWLNADWSTVLSSALAGSVSHAKRPEEDVLDYMHRLAKEAKLDPVLISELTDVPLRNVLYWYMANGYSDSTCDLEHLGEVR